MSSFMNRVRIVAGIVVLGVVVAAVARATVTAAADGEAAGGMGTSVVAAEPAGGAPEGAVAPAPVPVGANHHAPVGVAERPVATGGIPVVSGTLVVTLHPSARITGRWVRLGDVADLSGLAEVRLAALRDARLQRTPLAGAEKTLGGDDMTRKLRALGVVEPFVLAGSEMVTFEAAVRALGGAELVKFGHDFLAGKAGGPEADVQIEDPATPRSLTIPDADVEFRAEAPARRLAGLVPVAVEAWSGGERVARVLLSYRVRARTRVVRAARALESGQVIADADLEAADLDLAGVPEDAMMTSESLVGQRVTRPVAAGSWIRRGAVAQPLKVKRGATVQVIAKIGNVTAKASAQSRQDGAAGEIITVVNAASKRTLRARVVDENVVEAVMP